MSDYRQNPTANRDPQKPASQNRSHREFVAVEDDEQLAQENDLADDAGETDESERQHDHACHLPTIGSPQNSQCPLTTEYNLPP